ncbi:hypothetical protein DFH28DRAFT_1187035 [Melampsora americana]|nr:hypothetical protein DFH28DRAFT_1187035 [Melampsora americana]
MTTPATYYSELYFAQDFPSPATVAMERPRGFPEPDPTLKIDVSPRTAAHFAAPTFEAFAQAPTSSVPLSNVQESGLSEAEFEEITKEEFERNISASAHVLGPNVLKHARKLMEKAAQIYLQRGIHPPAIDGVKVVDLTGEGTLAPTQPHQSSRPEDIEEEEEEDNLSDDQPLETSDHHGATSAEHDDSLVTGDHHDELETEPPSTNPIQPTSQISSQSVLFELEDELLQERKKAELLTNQPIWASFVTSPSAINPALITQPNPVPNTGNISNPPLSPAHDNSTAQSPVQLNTQSYSQASPTRSAVCSATPPPNNHPASPTQTALPQSSAASVSPNPPASPCQPLIEDTTAASNKSASTFPPAQNQQSPQIGSSQNTSNNKESTGKNTPEEQFAALDLDSMDIDLPVPCLLPEIDPSLETGTESNTQNLFSTRRDVFVAAFKKFPIRMTPAKYSKGCDLVLKLLELRLKHIPTIINPKYLLPKGFKFHDTTMTGTTWLSELNQQDNCKNGPAVTVLAVVQAAADIQKEEKLLFKETIWARTHDYIMKLLSKNYNYFKGEVSAPQSSADFAYVQKGHLAICLVYDLGYYWSMKVPTSLVMGRPCPYLPALKLNGGGSIAFQYMLSYCCYYFSHFFPI